MHQLWSYNGHKRIHQDVGQVKLLCSKIQQEPSHSRRRAWRQEIEQYCYRLQQEQTIISRALDSMEQDWDHYMDQAGLQEYYDHLTQLYLLAGGHWAGQQEDGQMHELTHLAQEMCNDWHCRVPPKNHDNALPAQHSRGRSKLFKS